MKKFLLVLIILMLLSGCLVDKESNNSSDVSKEDITTNTEEIPESGFLLAVDGVYYIGHGIVVSGQIVNGTVKIDDEIEIVGAENIKKAKVKSILVSKKNVQSSTKGDNAALLLNDDISREDIKKGDVLATPGTISNHTEFKANIYVLTSEEKGGENPIVSGSTQQFFFRTEETSGTIILENEELNLGEIGSATIKLDRAFAFYKGKTFYIRNNGKIIAYGKVSEIIK